MVASNNTVREILQVISNHVNEAQLRVIIRDLKKIEGNQSFKDTIIRMEAMLGSR